MRRNTTFVPSGRLVVFTSILAVSAALWPAVGNAANVAPPNLGTAANYAVMGGSSVTSTGPTVVNGKLALSPGTSLTGGPTVTGGTDIHLGLGGAAADAAQTDFGLAFVAAGNATPATMLTGDLGGKILAPGVYSYSSTAQLTGTLTLDGQGNTNPTFIFQIGSALTTASNSQVRLINGAAACAVYWQVTALATLGTGTNFQGTLMALAGITMNTGATIGAGGGVNGGRALARTAGAVTMDSNQITPPPASCTFAAAATPSPTPTTAPTAAPTATPLSGGLPNASGEPPAPPDRFPWTPIAFASLVGGVLVASIATLRRRRR